MADKTLSSSIFRVSYATLEEPVAVTVLGRVIGRWVPVGSPVTQPRTPGDAVAGLTAHSPSVESVVRTPDPAPEPLTGNGSMAGITKEERAYIAAPLGYSKTRQAKGK
jgi:hypothetical protein